MAIAKNSVRLNITMSKELAKWVDEKAKEVGTTKSALVAIAVGQYKTQVTMTDLVSMIPHEQLQKLLADLEK